jgi:hypothetical protein
MSTHENQSPRWLSVDQIRKQQRMRREKVVAAMLSGELPYEQRGRIRYARISDVEAWEQSRLTRSVPLEGGLVHPDLLGYGSLVSDSWFVPHSGHTPDVLPVKS